VNLNLDIAVECVDGGPGTKRKRKIPPEEVDILSPYTLPVGRAMSLPFGIKKRGSDWGMGKKENSHHHHQTGAQT